MSKKGQSKPVKTDLFFDSMFDRKQILEKQQKLKRLYEAYKRTDEIEYFAKIKFKDITYESGEFIELHSLNQEEPYLAKLTKIIKVNLKGNKNQCFIEVEWVLRKNDLPESIIQQCGDFISSAEVFPSSEKIYLYVSSIKGKSTIMCIEQYGQLAMSTDNIYFSRANYDQERKVFVPHHNQWASDCECKRPTNPDLEYILCSGPKCNRWFHIQCVQSMIMRDSFLCGNCFSFGSRGMREDE